MMVMNQNPISGKRLDVRNKVLKGFLFRSVGCLLYEMCTYQHAFDGKGLMNVIYKVVEGKPPELPTTYSKELNDLLKKLVEIIF